MTTPKELYRGPLTITEGILLDNGTLHLMRYSCAPDDQKFYIALVAEEVAALLAFLGAVPKAQEERPRGEAQAPQASPPPEQRATPRQQHDEKTVLEHCMQRLATMREVQELHIGVVSLLMQDLRRFQIPAGSPYDLMKYDLARQDPRFPVEES